MIEPKDRKHMDFDVWLNKALKDPKLKEEYDRQQPEFDIIQAILDVRIKKGLTQKELAKKMGTKQSVISRLESGNANPTIGFLKKLADALGTKLQVSFK